MGSKDIGSINAIDWYLYIIRPLDIFSFVCNAKAYKKIKFIGEIKCIGYLYRNKLVEYYRSRKEFSKNIRTLNYNITEIPLKIEDELNKGLRYNDKAVKLINEYKNVPPNKPDFDKVEYLIDFYIDLFTYSTVFPYLVGVSMEEYKIRNVKIKKLVNNLRLVSYYPNFKSIVLDKLFRSLTDGKKLNHISLFDYLPEEILKFTKSGKPGGFKRDVFYYFLIKDKLFYGENKKVFKIIESQVKVTQDKDSTIKGQSVYKGIVKGRAKIIYTTRDFNKFNQGDILVTINSNPSLMPVIKKSKAIISDEGGITCHAAIVSRELKIPCVIGTGNATEILKDGDVVEVDADKGVVRVLERKGI